MGVFHGRDLFSTKWITAEIKDASKRLHYVPIKHTIGDEYFFTKLDGQLYCFKMDNELCQYRERATKTFFVYQYDTSHYRPIKSEVKELELLIQKDNLPKVNGVFSEILRIVASREKNNPHFQPVSLQTLIDDLNDYKTLDISKILPKKESQFIQKTKSIINYLNDLQIEAITKPVKGISNFIEDDLKATDPQFLGSVALTLQTLDYQNKKVTNDPLTSKHAWFKFALIFGLIAMIGMLVIYGYYEGWFDSLTNIGSGFTGFSGIPPPGSFGGGTVKDSEYYMKNYTPEELRAAIDRGEINEKDLPKDIQEMVKDVKLPKAEPKEPQEIKVEIGK